MSFPCCESIDMAVIPDDEISSVLIVGAGRLNAPIKYDDAVRSPPKMMAAPADIRSIPLAFILNHVLS